jgi:tripartite-type tricarboxylate transporter receptor subunit TctC
MLRLVPVLWAACCAALFFAAPVFAQSVADFYKGKTITIVVGYAPGGGYDPYARMLARHIVRHIPGNPTVVVQNMPGAGGMVAANHIANVAPKDGTALGVFSASTALEPLFGNDQAKFQTDKFAWIGNMYKDVTACAVWKSSKFNTLDDMLKSGQEVVFGSTGPGTSTTYHPLLMQSMLGAKVKILQGFGGIKEIGLALQKGEVDAACGMQISTILASFPQEYESGDLRVLIYFDRDKVPFFKNAVNFYDRLKSEEDKLVADLFFGQLAIARPLAGPPGMPADRTAALQKAMSAALKDPELLAEAKKTNLPIDPMTGEEVARAFSAFYKTPPAAVQRAKELTATK